MLVMYTLRRTPDIQPVLRERGRNQGHRWHGGLLESDGGGDKPQAGCHCALRRVSLSLDFSAGVCDGPQLREDSAAHIEKVTESPCQ